MTTLKNAQKKKRILSASCKAVFTHVVFQAISKNNIDVYR